MRPSSKPFRLLLVSAALAAFCSALCSAQSPAPSEVAAHRLILKDSTYQSITKYEIRGERVRYFSAERGEWEDVPKALIDWEATKAFEQNRLSENSTPEARELDKQVEAERKAEQSRTPEVAPGLHLPDEGGMFLLETYENQPQLVELQQSGGEAEQNTKANILRTALNPLAGVKQTISLPEPHGKVQSHSALPSIYVNLDLNRSDLSKTAATGTVQATGDSQSPIPTERFKIVRLEVKKGKRDASTLKIAVTGKAKTDERFVAATATALTGGWLKLTPNDPLAPGEYAVAEMLSKDGINLYVWDFGVNPSAPANASPWRPNPPPDQNRVLKKPE